ncbi:MAG: insulinase family protein [Caulobacteraceae bacterium]|nr:insulinase family protein [Caulobacteraceae bacterium]
MATDEDGVFTSPAENLALFKSSMGDLSADEVSRALRDAFDGAGPLVFISSPIGIEGGEAAIKSAFAQIEAEPIAAPAAEAKLAWPYASFGPPGHVVERKRVEDLDATLARFANGVRLTVKPTTFSADQVLVNVQVGDGLLSLPKNRSTLRWAADSGALLLGGLKKIDVEDTEKVLSDKIYSLGFGTREDTMSFSGATRPEDLDTQMQVLAAYVTDPGFRPEAFEHVRSLADPLINDQDSSPGGVMQRQLSFLLHDGDPRWAMPTRLDVAVAKLDDMRAVVAPALAKGAIEITVVGNVSVDRVIAAVAATFGALPDRPAADTIPEGAREVHFPAGVQEPVRRYHKGRDDQAIFLIAWPSADMLGDFQTSRDLRILEKIINTRLFEQFRIADGVAYETDTALETSQIFPGYGYIYAFAEAPPAKQALFYALIAKITADLKAHPVSAEELERAKQPRVELFTKARQTNSYWLTALTGAQADPRRLEVLRTTIPALEHVTAADVQRLARTYLTDEHAWKMTIEPQGLAPKPDPAAPKATGTAVINCARASDNRLGDCHVVQETPPGIGVGAQALMMVPNLTVDPAKAPPSMGGRIQFTLRVRAPDPGA